MVGKNPCKPWKINICFGEESICFFGGMTMTPNTFGHFVQIPTWGRLEKISSSQLPTWRRGDCDIEVSMSAWGTLTRILWSDLVTCKDLGTLVIL